MSAKDSYPKYPVRYECKECHFITSNKKDFNRHNDTNKHKLLTEPNFSNPQTYKEKKDQFECKCGNVYKHATNLSRHKRSCSLLNKKENEESNEEKIIKYFLTKNCGEIVDDKSFIIDLFGDKSIGFQKIDLENKEIYIISVKNNY